MPQAGDLLLVHMLEPQPPGTYFDRARWPLHITLMQWFRSNLTPQALRDELDRAARDIAPFEVTVGEEAFFGPNQDIPVNVITQDGAIRVLHETLLETLRHLGLTVPNEQWVGKGYTPHITQQSDEHRSHAGQVVAVGDFHLIRLINESTCEIIGVFTLEGRRG